MAGNLGLIGGRVYASDGRLAPGIDVALSGLRNSEGNAMGYGGEKNEKFIYATTDKNGLFWIRFEWSGADIGLIYAIGTVSAFKDVKIKGGSAMAAKALKHVRLALFRDFATVMNTAGSSLNGAYETLDAGLDFWHDIRKVKSFPVWKTVKLWSSESWILAGGTEMSLA